MSKQTPRSRTSWTQRRTSSSRSLRDVVVRGAINNGVTKDEIREVFIQSGIYCGVPAAIDSFRTAKEVFKEMGI